jgi:hypothetical protein
LHDSHFYKSLASSALVSNILRNHYFPIGKNIRGSEQLPYKILTSYQSPSNRGSSSASIALNLPYDSAPSSSIEENLNDDLPLQLVQLLGYLYMGGVEESSDVHAVAIKNLTFLVNTAANTMGRIFLSLYCNSV